MSADRGCKLLAMLAWLIISVPRAPKGSTRFRSSGRNFWPVATTLRPRGKHKIPQKVSGLGQRNNAGCGGASRGCWTPGGAGFDPGSEGTATPAQFTWNKLYPPLAFGESIHQHSPRLSQPDDQTTRFYRCRSSQRRGPSRRSTALQGRPSKRGKPRPRGQRLEGAVTDRFGGFGRAGLGGFERAAFLLWKLLARLAPAGAGPIHKDRRCPSLFGATRSRR